LTEHGITNLFCRGHVWQRDKAIRDFNNSNTIKVIMLSSESAASGTNLTKAEIVILLDPVYGTAEHRRNTEWQAIGRAYRMGQTKTVEVIRFVMENSVEQEIYDSNIKHDKDMNINSDVNNMQIVMDKSIVTNIVQSATTIVKKPRKKTIKP
jgi:SNF2 family DNA or RNA helicase